MAGMRLVDADAFILREREVYCTPCKGKGADCNGTMCRACVYEDILDDLDDFVDWDINPAKELQGKPKSDGGLTPDGVYGDFTHNGWELDWGPDVGTEQVKD